MDAVTKEQTTKASEWEKEEEQRHKRAMVLVGVLASGYASDRIIDKVIEYAEEDMGDFGRASSGFDANPLVLWTRVQLGATLR